MIFLLVSILQHCFWQITRESFLVLLWNLFSLASVTDDREMSIRRRSQQLGLCYAVSRLHRIWWNSHFRPKLFEMQEFRHTFCQQPKLKIYKNLGQSAVKCVYPTLFLVWKNEFDTIFYKCDKLAGAWQWQSQQQQSKHQTRCKPGMKNETSSIVPSNFQNCTFLIPIVPNLKNNKL